MNSMNSADVSAKNGQIRENIKFYFNIGKECKKRNEKADLDELAGLIQDFIKNGECDCKNGYGNDITVNYSYIALKLHDIFIEILGNRTKRDSKLKINLINSEVLKNSSSDLNDDLKAKMWLKSVIDYICNHGIEGGNFTVFRGDIKTACENLAGKLSNDLENKTWKSENGVFQYSLYNDGYLKIKCEQNCQVEYLNEIEDVEIRDSVKKVSIPSVKKIGNYAFFSFPNLKEITIPNSVEEIELSAFSNLENLRKITIPNSVKSIGTFAFQGCKNLKEITIPNSVESIGAFAFQGCENLTVKIAKTHPKLEHIKAELECDGIDIFVNENV